jgi:hypothetical protein
MALDAYHRELAKLNSVSSCPTVGSPAGLPGKSLKQNYPTFDAEEKVELFICCCCCFVFIIVIFHNIIVLNLVVCILNLIIIVA